MSTLLEVDRLNSYYGDSHILFDVSLHVDRNEVVALLGRNGAGKSTTLNSLMGLVRPRSGKDRARWHAYARTCAPMPLRRSDCSWCLKNAVSLAA